MSDLSHYNNVQARNKIESFIEWKAAIVKYCIQDSVALHQIIITFAKLIFDKFNIDINKYPTIPSLAFAIYRSKYMPADTIPVTKGKVFDYIRQAYTGGSTAAEPINRMH